MMCECSTSGVKASHAGRSSWLGEATKRQPPSRPSGPSLILLDAEALHAVAQLPERDAEELRRGGAVEPGLAERFEDRLALEVVEVVGQRPRARARGFRRRAGRRAEAQVFGANLLARRKSERSLEDVLELADVAWEVVALQLL